LEINKWTEGEEITGFYLLKGAEVKQTGSTPPKDYFDLILADKTGEVLAKMWDITATDKETFFPGLLVKVKGMVQSYREKLQFKVVQIRPATEEDGQSIVDYIRTAPAEPKTLSQEIFGTVALIEDEDIRAIVNYCLEAAGDRLATHPAAKSMHHNFYGGLAYHTVRMLELGKFICAQRPFLNADLIRAGIILHDIAKTEELIADLGIVKEYSLMGRLIGHISIAMNWVAEAAIRLELDINHEKVIILQHLILSHHNLGEWGSPVQPQVAEAVAIHHIDQLDAKLQAVEDALDMMSPGEEWTAPLRIVENKQIYRPRNEVSE
jgi:3'-5' exoribonuclease